MKKINRIFLETVFIVLISACTVWAQPFWSADNVMPGQTSMFFGDGLEKCNGVEISLLSDNDVSDTFPKYVVNDSPEKDTSLLSLNRYTENYVSTIKTDAIQANDKSVKFILDDKMSFGVYDVRTINSDGTYSPYFRVNKPIIQWVQGENGFNVIPGAYIRVNGKNLSFGNENIKSAIVDSNNNVIKLTPSKIYDEYSVEYKLPDNLSVGEYKVYAHNGFGGETSWSEPIDLTVYRAEKTSERVFNVKDYGAKGDGLANENSAVMDAIEDIKKNNGGILYFPRGRYLLSQPIELPRYTKMCGEKMEYTQIFWTSAQWDFYTIPTAMIICKDNFEISELSFYGSRMGSLVKSNNNKESSGNIVINRVNARINPFSGRTDLDYLSKVMNEIDRLGQIWTLDLGGSNIRITDSVIYCGSCPLKIINGKSAYIKNNTFYNGYRGWWSLSGLQNSIIEDNIIQSADLTSTGGGVNNLFGANKCANYYFARNTIKTTAGNDREPFTLDGGGGGFVGNILSVSGSMIVLPESANKLPDNGYIGSCVMIVSGKGMGQYREVAANTKNTITLSSAFNVQPDSSSVLSMCGTNKNIYVIDNDIYDSGHLQLYGVSLNAVIDGNKMTRSSGINAWGQYVYEGYQPEMYLTIKNNEIFEGNYCHAQGIADGWSGNATLTVRSTSDGVFQIADIVRNNILHECASLEIAGTSYKESIKDVIVENNSVSNHKDGIVLSGNIYGIFLRNNSFSNIDNEYVVPSNLDTQDKVIITD